MSISVTNVGSVNSGSVANNGTAVITVGAGGIPAHATIVVAMLCYSPVSVTDSKGNTYAQAVFNNFGNPWYLILEIATNVAALNSGDTITLTNTSGANSVPLIAQCAYLLSSINATISNDSATNAISHPSGANVSLASGSPTHNNECFIGVAELATTGKTITLNGSGWSQIGSTITNATTGTELAVGADITTGNATATFNPSISSSSSGWDLLVAGFYEAASSGKPFADAYIINN